MGGATTEISDADHRRPARDGVVPAAGDRQDVAAARPAHRGVGPVREGHRPETSTAPSAASPSCSAPRGRAGRRARSTSAASCPTRTPVRVRTTGSTRCSAPPRRATRSRGYLEPIGFALDRRRRRPRRHRSRLGARLRHRDRRRSRRSPATTATSASARTVPPSVHVGCLTRAPAATAGASAGSLVGLGLAEAMPMPFLAPGDQARAGLARRRHHHHQPAGRRGVGAAHVAAARAAKAVAYNARHRNHGVRAVRDRPRVPAGRDGADAARRARAPRRRRRRRGGAGCGRGWWALAEQLGATTLRASSPASRRAAPDAVGGGRRRRRRGRRGRRGRSRRARRPSASPSGSPGSSSTSAGCSALPHGDRPFVPFSRFPSSDVDLAFEVDERVPAAAVERCPAAGAGELLVVGLRLFDVYRGARRGRRAPEPGVPAAVPGPRPHAHRRRGRRRPPAASSPPSSGRPCEAARLVEPTDTTTRAAARRTRGVEPAARGHAPRSALGLVRRRRLAPTSSSPSPPAALGPEEYAPLAVLWALCSWSGPGSSSPSSRRSAGPWPRGGPRHRRGPLLRNGRRPRRRAARPSCSS